MLKRFDADFAHDPDDGNRLIQYLIYVIFMSLQLLYYFSQFLHFSFHGQL
jgi:hypothetical protein